ncbi:MAG: nicotinate-nucleotide diphosphorylase (carboxylating), partial [Gammaproteobacteria bacterium]|nr:nicotinate-nucleotide diphosphorylase (carboxylating) [Gammaproteobacteria bacterium]
MPPTYNPVRMEELDSTIRKNVRAALQEDLGHGDLTAALIA